jgi:hypothetical protein
MRFLKKNFRFLKKNFLTDRRVDALEILASGTLTPEAFSFKMWGAAMSVGYGAYFLGGLMGLGLVEASRQAELLTYQVTDEGRTILTSRPWICRYCGEGKPRRTTLERPCRECQAVHWICRSCSRRRLVNAGIFPNYLLALRDCPKGGNA